MRLHCACCAYTALEGGSQIYEGKYELSVMKAIHVLTETRTETFQQLTGTRVLWVESEVKLAFHEFHFAGTGSNYHLVHLVQFSPSITVCVTATTPPIANATTRHHSRKSCPGKLR